MGSGHADDDGPRLINQYAYEVSFIPTDAWICPSARVLDGPPEDNVVGPLWEMAKKTLGHLGRVKVRFGLQKCRLLGVQNA